MPQSNQCILCMHYRFDSECDAFPKGIPKEIFTGAVEHNRGMPELGQKNDIIFELLEMTLKGEQKLI